MTERFANADALVDRLTGLVSLPDVYLRVQHLMNDPDTSASDIARAVSSDPALTARLLKIANSPFFGMASKIDTISRAITIMGTQHLHDFLLATSMTSAFGRLPNPPMDLNRFWTRSVRCAIIARLIAIDCRVLDSERLFVAGLLSDIGQLVMYQLMPQQTAEAVSCAEAQGRSLAEVERELFFGFDYAEVGATLLQRWHLPVILREVVAHHNEPDQAHKFYFETAIVHAARIIGSSIEKGDKAVEALSLIAPSVLQQTGLSEERLAAIETRTHRQLSDTMSLLLPGVRLAS